jgi:predicted Zn-dependent protease
MRLLPAKTLLIALALISALTGCMTNPVTGRKQLNLVSQEEELQLGLSTFDKMKQEVPISRNPEANAMLQRVGQKVAAVAHKDMPEAKWEFVLFENAEPNAFCLPGGKVGVHTGLLPIAKDDAGLATVIGHEIGHATARHAGERISRGMLLDTTAQAAGVASSGASGVTQNVVAAAFGIGGPLLVQLPHSRAQESEADRMGLIYMARAGYPPEAALDFWRRFSAADKGSKNTPGFLRTHPVDSVRIKQIAEWIPEVRSGGQISEAAGAQAPIQLAPSGQGSQVISRPK